MNNATKAYKRIFVSLDGSERQHAVLSRAIELARQNHAELYLGHVVYTTAFETAESLAQDHLPDFERTFRESIADQVKQAEESPEIPKVEIIVRAGRIRETLSEDMLDLINPDLVVCGARGLSSIKYALLGSISTYLSRTTTCDTLIIKD